MIKCKVNCPYNYDNCCYECFYKGCTKKCQADVVSCKHKK